MTVTEITSKRGKTADDRDAAPPLEPASREPTKPRMRIVPLLITLATVALAGLLGWAMWGVYMGAPWTRDATVRAYVVTMAPEVAGRIVELHVVDNKYVRKGDLLMVIDPTNYRIAVSQSEAAVQQAQASVQSIDAQMSVQQAQIALKPGAAGWGAGYARVRTAAGDRATRPWRKTAGAAFRMPSSSRPSCISRRPRCRLHSRTSTWRSGNSSR